MTDTSMVETATEFASTLWRKSAHDWIQTIVSRDAAIREATAREVLDRVEAQGTKIGLEARLKLLADLRREFCPTPHSPPATPAPDAIRAKVVEVLREVLRQAEADQKNLGHAHHAKWAVERAAARHGIDLAELEEKKYTVGDIKVVDVRRVGIVIGCGDKTWDGDGWTDQSIQNYSMKDAEAIAARLRADGNVPGGGK